MSQLELSIKPQRGALIEGQANVLHALVSVSAPDAPSEKIKRTPLNLSLVIDRSGSMQGAPMQAAIAAALSAFGAWALTRELAPDDNPAAFVSLVLALGGRLPTPPSPPRLRSPEARRWSRQMHRPRPRR